jgi:hypothetical protein
MRVIIELVPVNDDIGAHITFGGVPEGLTCATIQVAIDALSIMYGEFMEKGEPKDGSHIDLGVVDTTRQ